MIFFRMQEGWVEQDPMELLSVVEECIEKAVETLIAMEGDPKVRHHHTKSHAATPVRPSVLIKSPFHPSRRTLWPSA